VPHSEQVVKYQTDGSDEGKASANPQGVGHAPNQLSHHLRVTGDANDASFVEVNLGLLDGGNF